MLILNENFRRNLEDFASEPFTYIYSLFCKLIYLLMLRFTLLKKRSYAKYEFTKFVVGSVLGSYWF